jgi:hypothetical protein
MWYEIWGSDGAPLLLLCILNYHSQRKKKALKPIPQTTMQIIKDINYPQWTSGTKSSRKVGVKP